MLSFGDKLDVLIALNQDTMNRHLGLMTPGSSVLYNKDKIKPDDARPGSSFAAFSVKELAPAVRGDLVQNTIGLAAVLRLIGVEFKILEEILTLQFKRKGEAVVAENVGVARAGYDYAARNSSPWRSRCRIPAKDLRSSKATRRWRWAARRREFDFTAPIR